MTTYVQVIKLVFVVAPDRVVEVVSPAENPQCLVRVVPVHGFPVVALGEREAPVLDVDVLVASHLCFREAGLGHGDGGAVEVSSWLGSDKGKDRGCEIGVRRHNVGDLATRHVGPADDKWDVDVLFKAALLAGLESVLADVVAVVGRVDDVRVVEDAVVFEARDDPVDYFV